MAGHELYGYLVRCIYLLDSYKHKQRALQEVEDAAKEYERRGKQAFNEAMRAKEETNKYLQRTMQE